MQTAQNNILPPLPNVLPNVRPLQANGQTRAPSREAPDVQSADYAAWKARLADQNSITDDIPETSATPAEIKDASNKADDASIQNPATGDEQGDALIITPTSVTPAAINVVPGNFSQTAFAVLPQEFVQTPVEQNIPVGNVSENSASPNLSEDLNGAGIFETGTPFNVAVNSSPQAPSPAMASSQKTGIELSADTKQTPSAENPAVAVVGSTPNSLIAPQTSHTNIVQTGQAKPKQTAAVTNQVAALTTDAPLNDASTPDAPLTLNTSTKPDLMATMAGTAPVNPQPQNPITIQQSAKSTMPAIETKPLGEHGPTRRSQTQDTEQSGNSRQPAATSTQPVPSATVATVGATNNSGGEQQNFGQLIPANPASGADALVVADKSSVIRVDGMQLHTVDRPASHRIAIETQAPAAAQVFEHSPPIRELAVQISQHMDAGLNRFKMRLDPPELGRIDVRMEISPEGKLTAVIAVERPETLDLLQRDARALERSLMDAGIKTDSGSLNFSLRGGPNDGQRHANQNTANGNVLDPWMNGMTDLTETPGTPIRFANRAVNIRI